ncbi:hypothetical protein BaRGS_00039271 [Batillaria attramentaria]|uniref:Uncharacterized protein n=1 Tax=Batillaria attramentaria TaxID=370345 RepID=A0ABD0J3J8_9CAEN
MSIRTPLSALKDPAPYGGYCCATTSPPAVLGTGNRLSLDVSPVLYNVVLESTIGWKQNAGWLAREFSVRGNSITMIVMLI